MIPHRFRLASLQSNYPDTDRQEIMVRVEPNRFEILEYDRWAEPLDENFIRVLMENLSALLRAERIVAYPWPRDKKPCYRVDVRVLRFESNSARKAELTARWTVTDVDRKEQVVSNELRIVRPAKDNSIDAAVTALSETVADLSWEIARTLMEQGEAGRATTPKSATEPRSKNNRDLPPETRGVILSECEASRSFGSQISEILLQDEIAAQFVRSSSGKPDTDFKGSLLFKAPQKRR
jgi:uncharacterized lipoprotein YmbA